MSPPEVHYLRVILTPVPPVPGDHFIRGMGGGLNGNRLTAMLLSNTSTWNHLKTGAPLSKETAWGVDNGQTTSRVVIVIQASSMHHPGYHGYKLTTYNYFQLDSTAITCVIMGNHV